MPKLKFERRIPHSSADMLSLVADVETYPLFVPNCEAMQVKRAGLPAGSSDARMTVRLGPIAQAYTSRVAVDATAGTISAHALDGPFSHLDSLWQIVPDGDGSQVTFEIDFAISNPLIAAVAEPAFAAKQEEIVDAFLAEADRRFKN